MNIHVDLVLDPICPWCYIGFRRFWRARSLWPDVDFETTYRAYLLNPDTPKSGWSIEDYLRHKFGSLRLANHLFEAVRRAGAKENIDFKFEQIRVAPSTIDAQRLIKWSTTLGGHTDQVVETLFYRYFSRAEDISQHDVLISIARDCGMDWRLAQDLLKSNVDYDRILTETQQARHIGVRGIPFFIFNHHFSITGVEENAVYEEAIRVSSHSMALFRHQKRQNIFPEQDSPADVPLLSPQRRPDTHDVTSPAELSLQESLEYL